MSQQNLISVEITPEDVTQIKDAIAVLKEKLIPHLSAVNSEEKMELSKMGAKTVFFVQKALEYCQQNPELKPPYLDAEEFERDFNAVVLLREFYQPLNQIVELLDDSQTLAGSDAYQAALMYYNSAKSAVKSNVTNAAPIYEDLASRFPVRNRKKPATVS